VADDVSVAPPGWLAVEGQEVIMAAGAKGPLFASPSIVAEAAGIDAEDGSLVFRSTDPLGAY
jgi:hypothetical protein